MQTLFAVGYTVTATVFTLGLGSLACAYAIKTRVLEKATLWESLVFLKDYVKFLLRDRVVETFETGKVTMFSRSMAISYFRGDVKYSVLIPTSRGIKPIQSITLRSVWEGKTSSGDEQALLKVMEYAGPSRDFHGIPITPLQLGVGQSLIVTYSNNVVKEYGPMDIISVTLPT